jgi:hypothetical protein
VFNRSRVDRASRSSRVTISTSSEASWLSNRRSRARRSCRPAPLRGTPCPPLFLQRRDLRRFTLAAGRYPRGVRPPAFLLPRDQWFESVSLRCLTENYLYNTAT